MIVKEVQSEELLTLAEVKEILEKVREERAGEEEELGYELRKAIHHASIFARLSAQKSRELVNKLLEMEKMKPEIAVKIADITPLSRDEVRTIFAKERFNLTDKELDAIVDLVKEALES